MQEKQEDEYVPVYLNIHATNDKLLYYKRKFELLERKIEILPFWNNLFIWIYSGLTITNIYFIYYFLSKTFDSFNNNIALFLFEEPHLLFDKRYLYILLILPIFNSFTSFILSYKFYNTKRPISYYILTFNTLCNILMFIALYKIIQINFAIF